MEQLPQHILDMQEELGIDSAHLRKGQEAMSEIFKTDPPKTNLDHIILLQKNFTNVEIAYLLMLRNNQYQTLADQFGTLATSYNELTEEYNQLGDNYNSLGQSFAELKNNQKPNSGLILPGR